MNYDEIQAAELASWNITEEGTRKEKAQREKARYPMMRKLMGLESLDTGDMVVYDIGAGPLGGVSSVVPARRVVRVDPLADGYRKAYAIDDSYLACEAESLDSRLREADLIIVTNALDHFRDPDHFLADLREYGKPGVYFAHAHAIDNADTHPHPAHQWNVNPSSMHQALGQTFELVWNYDFIHDGARYGWVPYKGKIGQPAMYQLWRKAVGY